MNIFPKRLFAFLQTLFLGAGIFATEINQSAHNEKFIVVIVPSYNNSVWYKQNLDALLAQEYENYLAIYIDDCSPDNTGNLVESYLQKHDTKQRVRLVKNKVRSGAMANIYNAIHGNLGVPVPNDAIIVTYDGDDWFSTTRVLARINTEYQKGNIWLTYGNYRNTNITNNESCCVAVPFKVVAEADFRNYRWVFSHVRTFYAGLFKKIKKEDLMHENKFLPMTWDLAFMFPMLEMAGDRFSFIPDTLYIYNVITPLNDYKTNVQLQEQLEAIIRGKEKYQRLSTINEIL